MVDDKNLHFWFCTQVLPLEGALTRFISRNWRVAEEVMDLRQEVYERALTGARAELPLNTGSYVYAIARNHLINRAKRARIVSIEFVAEFQDLNYGADLFVADRHLTARDELRRIAAGLAALPPRCREVVRLRKVEGLTTQESAAELGVSHHTIERQLTLGMRALADFMLGGDGKVKRQNSRPRRKRA